jgi:hypothetical protein
MGWTTNTFELLLSFMKKVAVQGQAPRLMDFGSQDIVVSNRPHLDQLLELLGILRSPWRPSANIEFPAVLSIHQLLENSSVDYYCLDIDDRPRTIDIDLNLGDFDRMYKGYFDMVFNCGTTEHVSNTVTAFFSIHQMCRDGGIMLHSTPLFGMGNHGFVNLTPKFWHTLIWMNEYRVLKADCWQVDESAIDRGNIFWDHLAFINGLAGVSGVSYMIELALVKQQSSCFLPPIDIWPEMTRSRLISMLTNACRTYQSSRAVTHAEIAESVARFVKRMGK